MKKPLLSAAFVLSAALASANPITSGTWYPVQPPANDGVPFFDNLSWDGPSENAAFRIPEATEYLYGTWTLTELPAFTSQGGTSDYYSDHALGWDALTGSLYLDSGHSYIARSTHPFQVALLRTLNPLVSRYWAAFEDLDIWGRSDKDYNDEIIYWEIPVTPVVVIDPRLPEVPDDPEDDEPQVPEPLLAVLLGMGLIAHRLRR